MKNVGAITGYHAHVYFDADSEPAAVTLREGLEAFDVTLGRWHRKPVGPHPEWSYQVAFGPAQFADIVPFLALNRGDLTVFVHPLTDDAMADHFDHAIWLGEKAELDPAPLRPKEDRS